MRNIYKYYVAYKLILELEEGQKKRVRWLSIPAEIAERLETFGNDEFWKELVGIGPRNLDSSLPALPAFTAS